LARLPKLSIGLPVYNGERYLRETLDSILGQGFTDFELLISDNASTDATGEIARSVAAGDPRVTYHRNPVNAGASANFMGVFRRASARYFKWACADDRLAPGFLDAALRELEAHTSAVLCYGQVTLIDGDGRDIGRYEQGLDLRSSDVAERFRRASSHTGLLNVLQGVIRADALARVGEQGAYRGWDEVLVAELSLQGPIHEIPAAMLSRRMHAKAASAAKSVEEKVSHLDPQSRFSTYYWRHGIEHLRAIARAPVALATKAQLAGGVVRTMIQGRDHLSRELREAVDYFRSRF